MRGSDTVVSPVLLEQVRTQCRGQLCARRNGMPPKTRKFVVSSGFGPLHNMGVYNNNVDTIQRAFVERYFLCKEGNSFRPALDVASNRFSSSILFKEFSNSVAEHMPKLPRMSRQQVVDCYHGAKRVVYENALLSLQRDPLVERDSFLKSFVKFEKQDVSKAPRVINPRSARYNLVLGTYLKHAEKHYFKAINSVFGAQTPATVIKGVNSDVSATILRAKWDCFKHPVGLGLDATKFDMHTSLEALCYEHSFYLQLFPGSGELVKLLNWQLCNRGTAKSVDGSVEFTMRGTRSSGDLNTSLGNCLIMCAMVWVYAKRCDVVIELANNGDDCVVFMERSELGKFMQGFDLWFRSCGYAMTVETPVYEFEQVEFCQTRPVQLSSGWRMIRNHATVLTKDTMCMVPIQNNNVYRKWLHAVGEAGSSLASGSPVQESFYRAYLRAGTKSDQKFKDHVYRGTSMYTKINELGTAVITPSSRVSYYYAFGVLPDEQVELERYFDSAVFEDVVLIPIPRQHYVDEPGISLLY